MNKDIPVKIGDNVRLSTGASGAVVGTYNVHGKGGVIHMGYVVKLAPECQGYTDCKPEVSSFISHVIAHPSCIYEVNGVSAHDD